jgi:histidinol-phosphate phosphatase family protein
MTRRPAVFLDRDGVVNMPPEGWVTEPDDFVLLPGAGEAIRRLNEAGWAVVVVTNQSAVGRGLMTREQMDAVHDRMVRLLAESGARLDGIYVCPHAPNEGCTCRKPLPGMLLEAARELGLDLSRSVMVGDSERDIEAGKAAGCLTIAVASGKHPTSEIDAWETQADRTLPDLKEASEWILRATEAP